MCVAEGSRSLRLTAGTMERQRVKEDPLVEGIMCLFTLPSQDQPPEHKWTLPSSMTTTSPSWMSMRCRSLRMRTRKASLVSFCQDTICSRHDLFKTRSVQDTFHDACFCLTRHDLSKTHFTMLVSVSHPMSTSPVPVIEYVAPASAVTHRELSPVTEYVGACTCQHPCSAFSSNRTRGTYACCHLRSAFFSDRVRGVRTCCLLCSD